MTLDKYREAGKIASKVVEKTKKFVTPDSTLLEIAEFVESSLKEKGEIAFPCNLSLNEVAAHYTPTSDDKTLVGDNLLTIDLGGHVDGFISDTAFTLDFSGQHKELIKASQEALKAAIPMCTPGTNVRDIGKTIQETIESFGYHPISNLSGHLLGQYNLHAGINIPNIDAGDAVLEEDMVVAVEPFATYGRGLVTDAPKAYIYLFLDKKPVRLPEARKILDFASKTNSLPFAKRWIDLPPLRLELALRQLTHSRALYAYPVLIEKDNGVVSQAEHTVIVKDKPEITTA